MRIIRPRTMLPICWDLLVGRRMEGVCSGLSLRREAFAEQSSALPNHPRRFNFDFRLATEALAILSVGLRHG